MWRGAVNSAIKGKRGQVFLRDMITALDAMPKKELIPHELVCADGVCAMGAVAQHRGVSVDDVDPYKREDVAKVMDIAPALAAEISYENDAYEVTPKGRWQRMRWWAAARLKGEEA
jgi:hypothetical protein